MANAHPPVVGTQIRDRHTSQVSAHSRTHQHLCTSSRVQAHFADLVEQGGLGVLIVLLITLLGCQSSDEDWSTVPDDLKDLSRGDFGDVDFEISVSIVPGPSVESADDCDGIETCEVGDGGIVDCAEHVDLRASNIGFVFVVDPVFIKPVIDGGLEVDVVSEVAGSG